MFEKDLLDFNNNKNLCDNNGGRSMDKEMTDKGTHKIYANYDNRFAEFLSTQQLKELIESLRVAPKGTTLITFRHRVTDS
jgi:hypothetical protein